MAIDKSKWNMNVRVSQKTIDEIKKLGMTKAIKGASPSQSAEWKEGLRRLYTPERMDKLVGGLSTAGKGRSSKGAGSNLKKPVGQYTKSAAAKPAYTTGKNQPKKTTVSYGGKGYGGATKVTKGKDSVSFGEGVGKAAGLALNAALLIGTRGMAGGALAKVAPKLVASKTGKVAFGKKANAKAAAKIADKNKPTTTTATKPATTQSGTNSGIGIRTAQGQTRTKDSINQQRKEAAEYYAAQGKNKPTATTKPKPATTVTTTQASKPNNSGLNTNAEKRARELAEKNKNKGSNTSKNKMDVDEFYDAVKKQWPNHYPANKKDLTNDQKKKFGALYGQYLKEK